MPKRFGIDNSDLPILGVAMEIIAGILALGLFVYLLYVLIKPEAF